MRNGTAGSQVGKSRKEGVANLSLIARDMKALLSDATKVGGTMTDQTRAAIESRISDLEEQVRDIGESVKDSIKERAEMVDSYVQKRPWQAVGIASGLGLLFGAYLFRRRS